MRERADRLVDIEKRLQARGRTGRGAGVFAVPAEQVGPVLTAELLIEPSRAAEQHALQAEDQALVQLGEAEEQRAESAELGRAGVAGGLRARVAGGRAGVERRRDLVADGGVG